MSGSTLACRAVNAGFNVVLSRLRRFVPVGMFDRIFRKQFQLN